MKTTKRYQAPEAELLVVGFEEVILANSPGQDDPYNDLGDF
jgi:hypothetical protein